MYSIPFAEIQLNQLIDMKSTVQYALEIGDTSSFGEYKENGLYFQVKQGVALSFHTLSELLKPKSAKILQTDFSKSAFEQNLFYLALQQYRNGNNGEYPSPTSVENANTYEYFNRL